MTWVIVLAGTVTVLLCMMVVGTVTVLPPVTNVVVIVCEPLVKV